MSTLEDHHVQFNLDKEEAKSHHQKVEIRQIDEHSFTVNLGYLKIDHYYEFSIDLDCTTEKLTYLVDQSSRYLKCQDLKKNGDKHTLRFLHYTHKDKNENDEALFQSIEKNPDTGKSLICLSNKEEFFDNY